MIFTTANPINKEELGKEFITILELKIIIYSFFLLFVKIISYHLMIINSFALNLQYTLIYCHILIE